jgi:hypothetical protein
LSTDQVLPVKIAPQKTSHVKKLSAEHRAPHVRGHFHHHILFNIVSELYTQLPNMSKNSEAHLDKVETAVNGASGEE